MWMNQARQQLQGTVSPSYSSYRAPIVGEEGQRGRPKFHCDFPYPNYDQGEDNNCFPSILNIFFSVTVYPRHA